jgi:hypothetical protein
MTRELLIGCGNSRRRLVRGPNDPEGFVALTTVDIDPNCGADIEWNLERLPYEFATDNSFTEIHAYDVLEHTGQQGDWRFFFAQFSEFWRILRPGGRLIGKSPALTSPWLWGDPGHKRVICKENLGFLVQPEYDSQIGRTSLCDYRHVYRADFEPEHAEINTEGNFIFAMRAVKPSRISI